MPKFIALRSIQIVKENKYINEGEIIELSETEAQPLLNLGILTRVDHRKNDQAKES
jgi:hypothetical protein